MRRKMLITGVSGLLGNNLAYYFRNKVDVLGLYNAHPVIIKGVFTEKYDLLDVGIIAKHILEYDSLIIIHCASLTSIDQCEGDNDLTKTINVLCTRSLVNHIAGKNVKLIYISTDAVYDGVKGNFSENDNVNPKNYYGTSKYEGEMEALKNKDTLVLRTNIFGWNIQDKKSIGEWIFNELDAGCKINCFEDAYFSSIYTYELARVIELAIQSDLRGIYNCGSADSCSKYEFAVKIADCFGLDRTLISPISIDTFNFMAKRGKRLSLNVNKIQKALNYKLPDIDRCIETFYRDYKCGLPVEIRQNNDSSHHKHKNDFIPYGRQWIDENDIQAVVRTLRSEWLTQGPQIEEFEAALAEYCGAKYAVAVNSGTASLHIACLAAGIGNGDEVVTSPNTFVASANCVVYCDAMPVFSDIDTKTYNISPEDIDKRINSRTKAVIPVHFAGQSCDMESIQDIVRTAEKKYGHKIYIIEDACHALGSLYKNNRVGSCTYSDMTVMSFHPVKHITTGEGGMVLTNDEMVYKKLRRFRSHGITNAPEDFVCRERAFQPSDSDAPALLNTWYYEQVDLGYNYRITDIQCGLGISQMKRLDEFRRRRREIVNRYNQAFSGIEKIQVPFESENCDSNFHLYVLLFDFEAMKTSRARFMTLLKENGIQTQVHYIPVHTQPYYREKFNTGWGDYPNAERYYQKCLSIPLYPGMMDEDVKKVIHAIKNFAMKSLAVS